MFHRNIQIIIYFSLIIMTNHVNRKYTPLHLTIQNHNLNYKAVKLKKQGNRRDMRKIHVTLQFY